MLIEGYVGSVVSLKTARTNLQIELANSGCFSSASSQITRRILLGSPN